MNNQQIIQAALEQSARELNCAPEDFLRSQPVLTPFGLGPEARKYYQEPLEGILVSYGNHVVASVKPEYRDIIAEFIQKSEFYRCFELPDLHWLEERLAPLGQRVCLMSEYYLPDLNRLAPLPCPLRTKVLTDFSGLYLPQWSNALCAERRQLDVLGVAAYDGDKLAGLAGCSADCGTMWQIGVDVLPEYRRRGVAAALTSRLALEVLLRKKVPFYCSAWSNLRSVRNALKSGFIPAWVELTIRPAEIAAGMTQKS